MIALIAYLALVLVLLLFLVGISIYTLFLIYSSLMGSPYVPTKQKEAEIILAEACLKKGKYLVELGCGDGRILRTAAKKYRLRGTGIDVNPILILIARIKAHWQKLKAIKFQTKNIFNTDIRQADYVYLFLMPNLIAKLKPKLEEELKPKSVVISHGFPIEGWKKVQFKKLDRRPFSTYYYRLT